MSDNPYDPGSVVKTETEKSLSADVSPARAAYNIVSDTVTGINLRKRDNIMQAVVIALAVLFAAAVGAGLATANRQWDLPWYGGALLGAFAGLVLGFFVSGIFLMVYRALRHMKGKHD